MAPDLFENVSNGVLPKHNFMWKQETPRGKVCEVLFFGTNSLQRR